jgi:uncharacterized membrane protein YhaH (DUF805 family)
VVVSEAVTNEKQARADFWWVIRATILVTIFAVQLIPTQSAGQSPFGSVKGRSINGSAVAPGALSQAQTFDPAAAQLSSLWSDQAMSVIAPIIFGDFLPPSALTSDFGLSAVAPMAQTQGVDPSVSTVLNSTVQPGLLPGDGEVEAEQTAAPSSGSAVLGSSGDPSGSIVGLSGNIISTPGTLPIISAAEGIAPVCADSAEARELQVGGEYWNGQAVSTSPVQFPRGVFAGGDLANPLGSLGPAGDPANISGPGPAGSWCRPGAPPFSTSSPLASRAFWIVVIVVLVALAVFWLSRGFKVPSRDNMVVSRFKLHPNSDRL